MVFLSILGFHLTLDGTRTEETTTGISAAVTTVVNARISAAMEDLFCRLQKLPTNPSLQPQHLTNFLLQLKEVRPPPPFSLSSPTNLPPCHTGRTRAATPPNSNLVAIESWVSYTRHRSCGLKQLKANTELRI